MEVIQVSKEEFSRILEEKLKEVLLLAFMELIPYVSEEEQEQIKKIAGKPSDYPKEDFEEWNGP